MVCFGFRNSNFGFSQAWWRGGMKLESEKDILAAQRRQGKPIVISTGGKKSFLDSWLFAEDDGPQSVT
jgi:hypothetical protein